MRHHSKSVLVPNRLPKTNHQKESIMNDSLMINNNEYDGSAQEKIDGLPDVEVND